MPLFSFFVCVCVYLLRTHNEVCLSHNLPELNLEMFCILFFADLRALKRTRRSDPTFLIIFQANPKSRFSQHHAWLVRLTCDLECEGKRSNKDLLDTVRTKQACIKVVEGKVLRELCFSVSHTHARPNTTRLTNSNGAKVKERV